MLCLLIPGHLEKHQLPETSTMAVKHVAMCMMLPCKTLEGLMASVNQVIGEE
jgi:hypothetical protein